MSVQQGGHSRASMSGTGNKYRPSRIFFVNSLTANEEGPEAPNHFMFNLPTTSQLRLCGLSLIGLLTLSSAAANVEFEYTYEGKTIKYKVISETEKTVELVWNRTVSGDIILPEHPKDIANDTEYTLIRLGDNAFGENNYITRVSIPNSVTEIGEWAFHECYELTWVEMPNSLEKIGEYAFEGCESLTTLEIPNSVTEIGECAFNRCWNLTNIELPNSITRIAYRTFGDCGLVTVKIPDSVTEIKESAFSCCSSLTNIEIPNSVTEIGVAAFEKCESLISIKIPDQLTEIKDDTFCECCGLTSVEIPNSVVSIGKNAFSYCIRLESVVVGNSVTTIDDYAFYKSTALKSIVIGESVKSIGGFVFYNCTEMKTITVNALTPPSVVRGTFDISMFAFTTLIVPKEAREAYENHEVWGLFSHMECSGIEEASMQTDDNEQVHVYNIHGHDLGSNVDNLPQGIYILKKGSKNIKVVK